MGKGIEALVERGLLVWARRSAGYELHDAARKAQVKPDQLESWERGDSRPSIPQLRKLGRVYKRPLAVFFLPEPPMDFQPMRDFRRLPGEIAGVHSPQLRFEIRRAHSRRELALDLYEAVEGPPPQFSLRATLTDDPEHLGDFIRAALGITYDEQTTWTGLYAPLNHWRAALERAGVLVFQAVDIDVSEMRGFSISSTPLPAIVVNIKDAPRGRTFTMLHELCHIILHEGGLCDLFEESQRPPDEQRVEVFCNWVAGATLVPRHHLLEEDLVRGRGGRAEWPDEEIGALAARYGASREVMLRRLLICERTTEAFYRRKREQFEEEYEDQQERRAEGFAPPHTMAVSSAGPLLVQLIVNSYHQGQITASDVSDFLEVRLKHLSKIEAAVLGR